MNPECVPLPFKSDGYLREHPDGCSLALRIQTGAKRTAITGIYEELGHPHLSIALQAQPIEGRANAALIAFLAKLFSLPRSAVAILHGEHSRMKLVSLKGFQVSRAQSVLQSKLKDIF